MNGVVNRRSFIGGALAFASLAGCRSFLASRGRPNVSFGAISDIHLTVPESTAMLERALRYFRSRGVDAVMISGDLSDWGLISGLKYLQDTWEKVFPGGKGEGGRPVQRLFCTGNHDVEGFRYGDMAVDMHAQGYSEREALVHHGMKECWERVFGEGYADVRRWNVNGYDFIGAAWPIGRAMSRKLNNYPHAAEWFAANGATLDPSKPFFYFQHPPIGATVVPGYGQADDMTKALSSFGNAFAFNGHYHTPLTCGRSIWQGDFTAISIPSLSYTSLPSGYENGSGSRDGTSPLDMPAIDSRFRFEEAQGFMVSVFDDRVVLERRDFAAQEDVGEAWSVPLGGGEKPYSFEAHMARTPVPQFPAGASLRMHMANAANRGGDWQIALVLEFPLADAVRGARAFDYEVSAVPLCGDAESMVKRFLSPAFHKPVKDEPAEMRFWLDALDLPQDVEYRLEVRPRNSFGVAGEPIVSKVMRGQPGGASVRSRKELLGF